MNKKVYLTREKLENLKKELEHFKKVKRPAVIDKIKDARSLGDLAENSEYQSAREEQAFVEGRIEELEYMIKNARLIEENNRKKGTVELGSKVTCSLDSTKQTFVLVGSAEVDIETGKISNESPIGKALMGKRVGEEVEAQTPSGRVRYKILSIT